MSSRNRKLLTILAVVTGAAVLIGGFVAIVSRDGDSPTSVEADEDARPDLDLIRIDARATGDGTTGVVLVFDGELPIGNPERLGDATMVPSDGIGYLTQSSDDDSTGISVCGDTHWFPPPGNRTVDIFVPSDWFDPESSITPPITPDSDGPTPAKIVVCEPHEGAVQVSVWGSASGRVQDVEVRMDARTITVDIAPDPTAP